MYIPVKERKYTKKQIDDMFMKGYRTGQAKVYRDYNKTYSEIAKLIGFKSESSVRSLLAQVPILEKKKFK